MKQTKSLRYQNHPKEDSEILILGEKKWKIILYLKPGVELRYQNASKEAQVSN